MQVKNFRGQLRDCLSTGLKREDEHSRKALYFKIRDLVERFKNEPEWTAHVADTRRWLDFGIPEKRRSDNAHVNYFESSIGKSTRTESKTGIHDSRRARYSRNTAWRTIQIERDSLRLVAVDEVFAHTDEPNSRRALDLFKSMGFQLIVIVPWEAKARVAERYVDSFHLTVESERRQLRAPDCDSRTLRRCPAAECERGVNYLRKRSAPGRAFCARLSQANRSFRSPFALARRGSRVTMRVRRAALEAFNRDAVALGLSVDWSETGHRRFQTHEIPTSAAWQNESTYLQALGRTATTQAFREDVALLPAELHSWAAEHPLDVVAHHGAWPELLRCVFWFREHPRSGLYLRQIPVDGIDTKFLEQHLGILDALLLNTMPLQINVTAKRFESRHGLCWEQHLIRFCFPLHSDAAKTAWSSS